MKLMKKLRVALKRGSKVKKPQSKLKKDPLFKYASKSKLLKKLHTKLYGKKPSVSKLESLAISLLGGAGGAAIGKRIGGSIGKKADEAFTATAKADHAKKVKAYKEELAKFEKDHPVKKSLFGFGTTTKKAPAATDNIEALALMPMLLAGGVPVTGRNTGKVLRKGLGSNYTMPKDPGPFKHPKDSGLRGFLGASSKEFQTAGELKGGVKGLAAGLLTGSAAKRLLLKSRKAKSLKRRKKVNLGIGAAAVGSAGIADLVSRRKKSKKKA